MSLPPVKTDLRSEGISYDVGEMVTTLDPPASLSSWSDCQIFTNEETRVKPLNFKERETIKLQLLFK